MKRLSIQAINDSSSYEVSELSQGCYQFKGLPMRLSVYIEPLV